VRLERRHEPLLPREKFLLRVARYLLLSGSIILGSLALGILGYRSIVGLGWIDSILNASFILTGMGPVDMMKTDSAKLFASAYALFSGVVFISAVGVLLTPGFHRLIHHFHVDLENAPSGGHPRTPK
jgi:hypothetical protein